MTPSSHTLNNIVFPSFSLIIIYYLFIVNNDNRIYVFVFLLINDSTRTFVFVLDFLTFRLSSIYNIG